MKISEITVIYKRTVQMRQFEPAEVSVMIKAQVDPGEAPSSVITSTRTLARSEVEKERARLLDQRIADFENDKEKSV